MQPQGGSWGDLGLGHWPGASGVVGRGPVVPAGLPIRLLALTSSLSGMQGPLGFDRDLPLAPPGQLCQAPQPCLLCSALPLPSPPSDPAHPRRRLL